MTAPSRLPAVSVVVPAFNAQASIDAALESVFAQTYRDLEVIVVDDGSTDGTWARLQRWEDRLKVLRQENGGPACARNAGIRASRARLIAFLDADDVWLPEKLARQAAYFAIHPQTGLLHTAVRRQPIVEPPLHVTDVAPALNPPPHAAFCDLFHTVVDINTLTVMVPRAVLDEVGLFDERREIHVEDWDLWLRIAARHPIGYLPTVTAVRGAGGGMSGAVEKTFTGQAAVIRKAAPLCSVGCPLHPHMPRACLQRRWHRFHWERGYARLRAGDRAGARAAFLAALRHRPSHVNTWVQVLGTFAGWRIRAVARGVRQALFRRTATNRATRMSGGARNDSAAAAWRKDASPVAPRSLVQDTCYRRARRASVERLHDLDDFLTRRGDRRRILFQAASPMSYVIFRPVHEKLRGDPRLEFWFSATGSTWEPAGLFDRVGIHEHVVSARRAAWMKVDLVINADFWDSTWLYRRTRRMHLFHGVAGKYGLDAPLDLAPSIASYDRLLFPNADRLERYAAAGLVRPADPQAVLAGYPKVDRLVDGSLDPAAILGGLFLEQDRPTVVYAPTWSPYSSLNSWGESIVRSLADAGFNVIVKLHDRSYDLNPRGSGGVDWAQRMSLFRGHPGVRVVSDPDSTPYLAVADALVTDHSSVGFEFALRDRPIVVFDCPRLIAEARVTRSKVLQLRSAAEVVESPRAVVDAVTRQLEHPGLHQCERRDLGHRFFFQPGTATARAAAAVYDVLSLRAPEPSVARPHHSGTVLVSAAR